MSDKNISDSTITVTTSVEKYNDLFSQGDLLFWKCEYEKAKEHFQILLNQPSISQLDLVRCYNSLGAVNAKLQNYGEALNNYHEQLDILLKFETSNKKESDIAKCYMSIGKVYWLKQDYALAIDSYRKALDIVSTIVVASDLRSNIYKDLANLFTKTKEFDSAIMHFDKALAIDREQLRENHPKFGQTYADMGAMYYSQRDYKQALNYFMKARETWQKSLASTHIYIESVEKTIRTVQSKLGMFIA
jgi:tetratricopeptide (TPR) repeat protein